MSARYAIYYAPEPDHSLWLLGSSVIGYDARTGADLAPPANLPTPAQDWRALTEQPRRYGIHATLKAPFALRDGMTERDLLSATQDLASARAAVSVPGLRVALIGSFVALIPGESPPELRSLADACVRDLDHLRAPLAAADRERRWRSPLSARQLVQLDRWGYPDVFEDFRFHMTLTGPLPESLRERIRAALEGLFRPIGRPLAINALSIFRQDHRAERFRLVAPLPFPA